MTEQPVATVDLDPEIDKPEIEKDTAESTAYAQEAVDQFIEGEEQPSSMDMAMGAPELPELDEYGGPEQVTETQYSVDSWWPAPASSQGSYGGSGMLPIQGDPNITYEYGVANSRYASGRHEGVDFGVPVGTPVQSVLGGTVRWAKWAGKYGNAMLIQQDDGTYSLIAHLSQFRARTGDRVEAGQVIALSGNTGYSTGPHLHWEIRTGPQYGSSIDPMQWVSRTTQGSGSSAGGNNLGATNSWTARPGDAQAVTQNAYRIMRSIGANHQEARFLASVVMPESGGRAGVVNSIGATGLWQILYPVHRGWLSSMGISQQDLKNPLTNARAALRIYRDRLPRGRAWAEAAWEVTQLDGGRHRPYLRYV